MKKILTIFAIASVFAVSCTEAPIESTDAEQGMFLNLGIDAPKTRAEVATMPGVKELNENLITKINYYIFPSTGDDVTCLFSGEQHVGVDVSDLDGFKAKVPLNVTKENFVTIFGTSRNNLPIAVVANAPDGVLPTSNVTLAAIKAAVLQIANGGNLQADFVMLGTGTLVNNSTGERLSASAGAQLKRVLSKVTLDAHVKKFVDIEYVAPGQGGGPGAGGSEGTGGPGGDQELDGPGSGAGGEGTGPFDPELPDLPDKPIPGSGETLPAFSYTNGLRWTPLVEYASVIFYNGGAKSQISGDPTTAFTDKYFKFDARNKDKGTAWNIHSGTSEANWGDMVHKDVNYYECIDPVPFYNYPRTWTLGSDDEPYIIVMIPWQSEPHGTLPEGYGTAAIRPTYYKIILNNGKFESNTWYNLILNIDGLGSFIPSAPVEVESLELKIAGWDDSVQTDAHFQTDTEIKDVRVLDIPQEKVVLYNVNQATFNYYSSHDVVVSSVKLTQKDFSGDEVVSHTTDVTSQNIVTVVDGKLVFNHVLNNDITSSGFDYRDYVYTVEISHADDSYYTDSFVITQRPAVTIENYLNRSIKTRNQFVFVNGKKNTGSSLLDVDFGSVTGSMDGSSSAGGSNYNRNMYVMTASVLDGLKLSGTNTQVIIADPRSKTVDNLGLTTSSTYAASAIDVHGNTRRIENYYPSGTQANVIAPEFRVASSYGKTTEIGFTTAKKRCATYQEDGYPAGRWRVPTRAEVEFIATLSAKGFIPTLFTTNSAYWCSTGYVKPNSDGTVTFSSSTSNSHYVRCVYDEWYWKDSHYATVDNATFTWGDIAREDFE